MADTFKGIITADGKKRQLPYSAVLETPVSDSTLSKEGGFADSKAVGDKFAKVDSETASLKEDLVYSAKSKYTVNDVYLVNTDGKGAYEKITESALTNHANVSLTIQSLINLMWGLGFNVNCKDDKYNICLKNTGNNALGFLLQQTKYPYSWEEANKLNTWISLSAGEEKVFEVSKDEAYPYFLLRFNENSAQYTIDLKAYWISQNNVNEEDKILFFEDHRLCGEKSVENLATKGNLSDAVNKTEQECTNYTNKKVETLDDILIKHFVEKTDWHEGYVNPSGNIQSNPAYVYQKIISDGMTQIKYTGSSYGTMLAICFYSSSEINEKTLISYVNETKKYIDEIIYIPSGTKVIVVSSYIYYTEYHVYVQEYKKIQTAIDESVETFDDELTNIESRTSQIEKTSYLYKFPINDAFAMTQSIPADSLKANIVSNNFDFTYQKQDKYYYYGIGFDVDVPQNGYSVVLKNKSKTTLKLLFMCTKNATSWGEYDTESLQSVSIEPNELYKIDVIYNFDYPYPLLRSETASNKGELISFSAYFTYKRESIIDNFNDSVITFPSDYDKFERLNNLYRNPFFGKRWTAIGDSITARGGNYTIEIAKMLGMEVTNLAIGGAGAEVMWRSISDSSDSRFTVERMEAVKNADFITVWGFINDVTVNSDGSPRKWDMSYSYLENVEKLIKTVLYLNPTAKILVIGTTNAWGGGRPAIYTTCDIHTEHTLEWFNTQTEKIASKYGLDFINMYNLCKYNEYTSFTQVPELPEATEDNRGKLYMHDGAYYVCAYDSDSGNYVMKPYNGNFMMSDQVHPTERGYKEIVNVLSEKIKTMMM